MIDGISDTWFVAATVIAGSVLTGVAKEGRWWLRSALALGIGAALVAKGEGELLAAWSMIGIVLGDWGVRRWSPLPGVPRCSDGAIVPVTILTVLAAWAGWRGEPGIRPLLVITMALVVTAVAAFTNGAMDAAIRRGGASVGAAVSRAAFTLLAVPVIVVPWAAHRLARVDSLRLAANGETGWQRRRHGVAAPLRMWERGPEVPSSPAVRWQRFRSSALVALLSIALFGAGLMAVRVATDDEGSTSTAANPLNPGPAVSSDGYVPPAAYRDDDWYEAYLEEIYWAMSTNVGWFPLRSLRLADMEGRFTNISGGVRRSWRPPSCDCRRIRVWMYGGSTAFGLGQRDEHTIASALARAGHGMTVTRSTSRTGATSVISTGKRPTASPGT